MNKKKIARKKITRKKPKRTAGDDVYNTAKIALSTIPVVGGTAAEVFAAAFTPPIVRRRDEWINQISKDLAELEKTVKGFDVKELAKTRHL